MTWRMRLRRLACWLGMHEVNDVYMGRLADCADELCPNFRPPEDP